MQGSDCRCARRQSPLFEGGEDLACKPSPSFCRADTEHPFPPPPTSAACSLCASSTWCNSACCSRSRPPTSSLCPLAVASYINPISGVAGSEHQKLLLLLSTLGFFLMQALLVLSILEPEANQTQDSRIWRPSPTSALVLPLGNPHPPTPPPALSPRASAAVHFSSSSL